MKTTHFHKPTAYWINRAERYIKKNDYKHAAALLKQAFSQEPENETAALSYAGTLMLMECYESSNDVALTLLAHTQPSAIPFGLMSLNCFSLFQPQKAKDAISLYFHYSADLDCKPDLDEHIRQIDTIINASRIGSVPRRYLSAHRLANILFVQGKEVAAHRLLEQAERLHRAQRSSVSLAVMTLARANERLGDREASLYYANRALRTAGDNAEIYLKIAELYHDMGLTVRARAAYLCASACYLPNMESELFRLGAELEQYDTLSAALKHGLRITPFRVSYLYNLCLCLLRMNKVEEAQKTINRCRDMISGDVYVDRLHALAQGARDGRFAYKIGFYGSPTLWEAESIAEELLCEFRNAKPEDVCAALEGSFDLRKRWIAALSRMPDPEPLIRELDRAQLPQHVLAPMLRRLLACEGLHGRARAYARARLLEMDPKAVYVAQSHARVTLRDCASGASVVKGAPSFLSYALFRQLKQLEQLSTEIIPFALAFMSKAPHDMRCALAVDRRGVWLPALVYCYYVDVKDNEAKGFPRPTDPAFPDALKAVRKLYKEAFQ